MKLKDRIIAELKATEAPNIDALLGYMERNGFYTCKCHSHNNWQGGTAQHVWAVYQIAKVLRDQRNSDPLVAKYATDSKLAIVCLLHDLCDMRVSVYDDTDKYVDGHGKKSYWILKNHNVGTKAERAAVLCHMHPKAVWHSPIPAEEDEYNVLHNLVAKADGWASGTAWNSKRFIEGRTQHSGSQSSSSYLRAVAMDRSSQSGRYNLYIDEKNELRQYKNYIRDIIQFVDNVDVDCLRKSALTLDCGNDAITAARKHSLETGERHCLVVGVEQTLPKDNETRLRSRNKEEQNVLICSNILHALYRCEHAKEEGKKKRHRLEFTMRDEVKSLYRGIGNHGAFYLSGVQMIRDGASRGFPFVESWTADLLLVPGGKFDTFVVPAERVGENLKNG